MSSGPVSTLPDGVQPPSIDTIRLLRAYLVTDHARAAEIIKALDAATSDRVCADLVGIFVPMARLAQLEGRGFATDEVIATLPRVVKRMCGDAFKLTPGQVDELAEAWFADQPEQVVRMTRDASTRELWLHAAASFTMTVGAKAFGPQGFGAFLTALRKLSQ